MAGKKPANAARDQKRSTARTKTRAASSRTTKVTHEEERSPLQRTKSRTQPTKATPTKTIRSTRRTTKANATVTAQPSRPSPYQSEVTVPPTPTKKLFLRARHIMTPRSMVSLFDFDGDEVAVMVARFGGVACVLLGGFFTLWYTAVVPAEDQYALVIDAQCIGTDCSSATSLTTSPNTSTSSVARTDTVATPRYDSTTVTVSVAHPQPLVKTVPVVVSVNVDKQPEQIVVSARDETTKQSFPVGFAERKAGGTWEIVWDTTRVPNGTYGLRAQLRTPDTVHSVFSAERFEVINYGVVYENIPPPETADDATETAPTVGAPTESVTGATEESEEDQPEAALAEPVEIEPQPLPVPPPASPIILERTRMNQEGTLVRFHLTASDVRGVTFFIRRQNATVAETLGRGYVVGEGTWQFVLDTERYPVGTYVVYASVQQASERRLTNTVELNVAPSTVTVVGSANQLDTELLPANNQAVNTGSVTSDAPQSSSTPRAATSSLSEPRIALPPESAPQRLTTPLRSAADITDVLMPEVIADSMLMRDAVIPEALPESVRVLSTADLEAFQVGIQTELARVAAALRSGDMAGVEAARARIALYQEAFLADLSLAPDAIANAAIELSRSTAAQLVQVERAERIVRERRGDEVTKDTDRDGITDYDERELFGTNPDLADTDADGFTDGAEILGGFNPQNPEPEAIVAVESPQQFGVTRSDILRVVTVAAVDADLVPESTATTPALITGTGLPNSFVTLFIFSNPIVITLRTDSRGNWSYQFDQELADGEHEVYVGITDNAGRLVAKSEPFRFVKVAEAFTPVGASAPVGSPEEPASFYSVQSLLLVASISVVAIGVLLLLLGHHLAFIRRREPLRDGTAA